MEKRLLSPAKAVKAAMLAVIFVILTILLYLGFHDSMETTATLAQNRFYSLGTALLLSGLTTLALAALLRDASQPLPRRGKWFYPVVSGLLALAGMLLAYAFLGVWPLGEKSVMIVDMHHQYAPLLAKLRDMLLHGGSPLYSFEVGLGTSFLPLFGYYLASPFNLLLVLFPPDLLTEGILVITLLKNALSAAFFAACVQYIYKKRSLAIPLVSLMYAAPIVSACH